VKDKRVEFIMCGKHEYDLSKPTGARQGVLKI
jgi:hypothetical protein